MAFDSSARYRDGTHDAITTDWGASHAPFKAEQVADILHRNLVMPKSICDVGCGTGDVLRNLRQVFPEAQLVGYEISPQAIAGSDDQTGVELHLGDFLDTSDTYDVITLLDVFEHVADYMGFLSALRGRATYFVFHIPLDLSAQSVARSTPLLVGRERLGHLHHFTRETALATLRVVGFEIVDERFTTPTFSRRPRQWRERIARWPRRGLHAVSPALASRLLGGFPLLVLAR
jgi:cyclopropane fatty-acyl-phospholipid synthase-like methyltransferase